MPIATGNLAATERHDLKSLPDGYVVLKRLSHGESMARRGFLSRAKVEGGARSSRDKKLAKGFVAELDLMNEQTTLYEWAHCIVDHNLTFMDVETERKLDFRIPEHVKMVDGRVAAEIDDLITDLNNYDLDDEESDEGK